MFKVMIVDDEPMIRQGLQSLVEWDHYQFEVCAVASNGVEALEKYKEHQPELILVDIRMPIMDGLQTIHELRKLGADCRILILSGYGEFQYAQQAIRYRVDGYVLKPIDEDELIGFIEKISKELIKKRKEQEISSQTVGLLKEEWLKGFVACELPEEQLTAEHWQRLFHAAEDKLTLLLIETYSREHSLTIRNQIKQQLAQFVYEQGWGDVFASEAFIGILLHQLSMNSFKQERVEEVLRQACGESVYYVALLSEEHESARSLYEQVPQMKELLKQRFFLQENKMYSLTEINESLQRPGIAVELGSSAIIEQGSQRLLYGIDVGNKELVSELLGEIDQQFRALGLAEQQIKSSWAQLLTLVMNRLSTLYPKQQLEQDLKVVTQLYLAHHNHLMLSRLKEQLHSIIDRISSTENSNTTVMKQMIDFIDRHYMEPLRLETLAEIFNYNSGYLGKLFKNHSGESFNTYLDHVRIEHAIKLLQEGKKVHQVAELVGYANVDYFHSKFKKYKGVSPSTFKPGGSQSAQDMS
ncbi:DNA-binding response regulator [Paenibacillus montaniterrae]|uniref:DNA-binding response regulator n=1 Tax=Paenibacillus montaniterrae TaxID=429341 RepID=A0A919YP44_9BACL|nr:response regulator transcription factor [Paenibacillus montaniterrae]GIP16810.1 DNA-binding response regulator [Paenibacillus montaniterrae]